jgi:hypothetical protein
MNAQDLKKEDVLSLIRGEVPEKKHLKIWTSSRLAVQLGITAWWKPEYHSLLKRLDRILRDLERDGILIRREDLQTSRNIREEVGFEVICTDPAHPPSGAR